MAIVVLGATGSIGRQTLEVASAGLFGAARTHVKLLVNAKRQDLVDALAGMDNKVTDRPFDHLPVFARRDQRHLNRIASRRNASKLPCFSSIAAKADSR